MKRMTGAQAVVDTLDRLGVERVFQITGLGILPLSEAFYQNPGDRTHVSALSEANLSLIANGYARASGKPAFVNVYHSSGTALAMMGVTTAWADQVPLVLTSTVSSTRLSGRDQYAAVPRAITEMTQQYTKWSAEIPRADRIPEFLERAFQIAATPPFGPVHVGIPMDLLVESADFVESAPPTTYFDRTVDPDGTERLAAILRAARRPVIVAGGEVARYGAMGALERVADLVDAAVLAETKGADLAFPNTHPRFIGKLTPADPVFDEADVVVLAGVELTEAIAALPDFGAATTVQVSTDPLGLRRQYPGDVGILGDPRRLFDGVATRLEQEGGRPGPPGGRVRELRERFEKGRADLRARLLAGAGGEVSAAHITDALNRRTGTGIIVVNQCGSSESIVDTLVDYDAPWSYFGLSAKASAQGWGAAAAIGIQLARPDRRVVAILGDGGFMFNSTTIHTAAAYGVPVVFLVLDNGGWRDVAAVLAAQRSAAGTQDAEDVMRWSFHPKIDHAQFARSLGLRSWQVTHPEQLDEALTAAFADRRPTLIQVSAAMNDVHVFAEGFTTLPDAKWR